MADLLLTRPAGAAARFVQRLRSQDMSHSIGQVVISPLLRIEPKCSPAPRGVPAGLIFTSQAGVLHAPRSLVRPCYVVGMGTAEAACQAGFDVQMVARDARHLVQEIPASVPQPLWHLRGEHVAAPLAAQLRDRGLRCESWVCYDQISQPLNAEAHEVLVRPDPVLVPLFSPRSARLLAAELRACAPLAPLWIIAISNTVREAFADVPGRMTYRVAKTPDGDAMVQAVHSAAVQLGLLEGGQTTA